LPKAALSSIPVFGTGYSGQTLEWLVEHTGGLLFYPQDLKGQKELVGRWRHATAEFKPFAQPLVVSLSERAGEAPKKRPIGFRPGRSYRSLVNMSRQSFPPSANPNLRFFNK